MKRFLSKPYRWAAVYAVVLALAFSLVLLDTFVIPKVLADAPSATAPSTSTSTAESDGTDSGADASDPMVTENSYDDGNIRITIETLTVDGTQVYVADIQVTDASYLKTALAGSTYGRNIKETTSDMAAANDAILAINGDYYGFRDDGYVLRNGVLYRSVSSGSEDLVIDQDGNFTIIDESDTTLASVADDAWQILSFGPALIENGVLVVDENSEVSQSMSSNPRTAIGQVSALHYIVIVSDGRTSESAGLSLAQLAQLFADRGCQTAYNLDGGGSSTMVFMGEVVNNPTDGRTIGEREVSDIVYFGY